MSQSLAQVYHHVIFSTKFQAHLIPANQAVSLYRYIAGTLKNLRCPPIIVNGASNHLHLLCRMGRVIPISKLLKEVKRSSSKWMKTQGPELNSFYWQNGYGAFSIGPERVEAVKRYIANQEEHHRRMTFKDEFRRLLGKYRIDYDEKYVWD